MSENIVSSLGRDLQVLLKDKFSESYLNRILKLIFDNAGNRNYLNRILPQDTVICQYHIRLISPPAINDFLEYKKDLDSKYTGKSYLIMLTIIPPASTDLKISIEPEVLFRLLETVVACIKDGVQILKFEKPDSRNQDLSAEAYPENLLSKLIEDVIREISPSVLVITDKKQIQNAQLIKYLSRRVF